MENGHGMKADGVLGLGRFDDDDISFIQSLADHHIIANRIFSIQYFPDDRNMSKITFGSLPSGIQSDDIIWMDTASITRWSVPFKNVVMNGRPFNNKHLKEAIFATGLTTMVLPKGDYNHFIEQMDNGERTCGTFEQTLHGCYCSSIDSFPSLSFHFNRWEFKLSPITYIDYVPPTVEGRQGICRFKVQQSKSEHFDQTAILGDAFLLNFDLVFDIENQQVGIHARNKADIIDHGESHHLSEEWIIVIVVFGVLLAAVVITLIVCLCRKKKPGEEERSESYNVLPDYSVN